MTEPTKAAAARGQLRAPAEIIGAKTGVSVVVVLAVAGGVASNVLMISGLRETQAAQFATMGTQIQHLMQELNSTRKSVESLAKSMQSELRGIRSEHEGFRGRLHKIELELARMQEKLKESK